MMAYKHDILEKSRLGRLLVNRGLISESQLDDALDNLHDSGQRLGEFLVAQGLISEKDLASTLARQKRTRYVAAFFAAVLAPLQPLMATTATAATTTTVTALSITKQPQSVSTTVGSKASIVAGVSGSGTIQYAWFKDGKFFKYTSSATLAFDKAALTDAGTYQLRVKSGDQIKWSTRASLTVAKATSTTSTTTSTTTSSTTTTTSNTSATTTSTSTALAIVTSPQSISGIVGTSGQLSAVVAGKIVKYSWFKDGKWFKDTTGPTLAFSSLALSHAGSYQLRIFDGSKAKWSTKAQVTVTSAPVVITPDIKISLQPVGTSLFSGKSYTFNVSASGSGTLSYQWRKNGTPIPNAVLPYLSFSAVTTTDAGTYDVVITNANGPVTSQGATLNVTVDRTAKLNWSAPTSRVNGAALAPEEIAGYRIYHSDETGSFETTYDVTPDQLAYELDKLVSGKHYFAISAIDSKGFESELSNLTSKEIRAQ